MANLTRVYLWIYKTLKKVIGRLLGLAELFLFLRLMLKFFGASSEALVVELLYNWTDVLTLPFQFIFPDVHWSNYVIETATISAMIGYWLLYLIIFHLLSLFSRDQF